MQNTWFKFRKKELVVMYPQVLLTSSGLEAWYETSWRSCWSASVSRLSSSSSASSYTGVTLWHRAMALMASWMRVTTVRRTLGAGLDWLAPGIEDPDVCWENDVFRWAITWERKTNIYLGVYRYNKRKNKTVHKRHHVCCRGSGAT